MRIRQCLARRQSQAFLVLVLDKRKLRVDTVSGLCWTASDGVLTPSSTLAAVMA